MAILTKTDFAGLRDGQSIVGTVLIKSYTEGKTRTNKPFIDGVLSADKDFQFKVWDGTDGLLNFMLTNRLDGQICDVIVLGQSYNDSMSYILKNCKPSNAGYTMDSFIETRVNADAYLEALKKFLVSVLSQEGYALVDNILFQDEALLERFTLEFCAKSHHDNYKSGLLVHVYKVLDLMNFIITRYPTIVNSSTRELKVKKYQTDLYYIGAVLHDIGKTVEMYMGVYQPNTATTHRFLGVELISKYKDLIVATYDEKWYYDLVSIILQHHGEWGDPCTAVCSAVAHIADYTETRLTSLVESFETKSSDTAGDFIKFEGKRLFL